MSSHVEQPSYGDLLDTVRAIRRISHACRQYLPLHLGTNLVELAVSAEDQLLRAEVVTDDLWEGGHVNMEEGRA